MCARPGQSCGSGPLSRRGQAPEACSGSGPATDHAVRSEMHGKVAEDINGWLKKGAERAAGWGMRKREQ